MGQELVAALRLAFADTGFEFVQSSQIASSVDEGDDEDGFGRDSIEKAIRRNEDLAQVGIVELGYDAATLGQSR